MRSQLSDLVALNPLAFQHLVWHGSVQDHVQKMRQHRTWATQVELAAAASYFQVPVFSCTPHPQTNHYNWLRFKPHSKELVQPAKVPGNVSARMKHIELCNTHGVHFDCVLCKDDSFPTDFPFKESPTNIHIDSDY